MTKPVTKHSRDLKMKTKALWRKEEIVSGTGKNKTFFLRNEQIDEVEKALKSINPGSQVQALVELCKRHNNQNK